MSATMINTDDAGCTPLNDATAVSTGAVDDEPDTPTAVMFNADGAQPPPPDELSSSDDHGRNSEFQCD